MAMMRISTAWRYHRLAAQMARLERDMYHLQVQISTGKRVNRPSDDAVATGQILGARCAKKEIEARQKVIVQGRMLTRYEDQVLGEIATALRRTRDLVVRALNDSLTPAAREGIAYEVGDIMRRIVDLGNSQLQGRYLFAGNLDRTQPLRYTGDPDHPVEYLGSSEVETFRVGKDATVQVTLAGDWLFNFEDQSGNRSVAGVDDDLFSSLAGLQAAIRAGDKDAIEERLEQLDAFIEHIVLARAQVGVNDKRFDTLEKLAQDEELRTSEALSTLEDCDMAATITKLRLMQVMYEAILGAAAKAAALPSLVEMGW